MELNKIDLNKLNTFFCVVDNKSISGASEKLLLTRSAVSQSVSSLEAALAVRLFNRVGKKLILTSEGKQLYKNFSHYQDRLQRTLSDIFNEKREVQGLIRVGSFLEFSKTELTGFISRFLERHPRVQVKLLFSSPSELNRLLDENKIDLALSIHPHNDKNISSERLFQEKLVLVSGKRFYREGLSFAELQRLPVIDYYQNNILMKRWLLFHYGKGGRKISDLNVKVFAATADIVLEYIRNDVGVGVVPRYLAESHLRRGEIFQVKTGKEDMTDYIWLNELRGAYKNTAYRLFRDGVIEELSNL